jgi:nucleoid DNA-binding protein
VKTILDHMSQSLSTGERIEIRGFGSFSLHYRSPRMGRNPKPVTLLSYQTSLSHILNQIKNFAIK